MGLATAAILGGTIAAGAIAGSMKDEVDTSSGMRLSGAGATELNAQKAMNRSYEELQGLVNAGPGQKDVSAAYNDSQGLAAMLSNMSQVGGANPTAGDISTSNSLASQLFQGQRVALQQNIDEQNLFAKRQAAITGRSVNDPILRNKFASQQLNQQQLLDANQGSWAIQNAMNQPLQRLGFAQQRNGIMNGLATQAMQNRQVIAAMGEGIMNNERNFRLNTATRWGHQESGGGLKGALNGGIGGLAAGMGMANSMGAFGGGGFSSGGGGGYGQFGQSNYFAGANPFSGAGAGMAPQFQQAARVPTLSSSRPMQYNNPSLGGDYKFQ